MFHLCVVAIILVSNSKTLADVRMCHREVFQQIPFRSGLAGSNDWEAAKIDELNDGFMDIRSKMRVWRMEKDEGKKKELRDQFITETLKPNLERYTHFLQANGTGYFVGSKVF